MNLGVLRHILRISMGRTRHILRCALSRVLGRNTMSIRSASWRIRIISGGRVFSSIDGVRARVKRLCRRLNRLGRRLTRVLRRGGSLGLRGRRLEHRLSVSTGGRDASTGGNGSRRSTSTTSSSGIVSVNRNCSGLTHLCRRNFRVYGLRFNDPQGRKSYLFYLSFLGGGWVLTFLVVKELFFRENGRSG